MDALGAAPFKEGLSAARPEIRPRMAQRLWKAGTPAKGAGILNGILTGMVNERLTACVVLPLCTAGLLTASQAA